MINRRSFANLLAAAPVLAAGCSPRVSPKAVTGRSRFSYSPGIANGERLIAPEGRQIRVAFAINPGVQVIDVAGPWETFQDTYRMEEDENSAFSLFTVSETSSPVVGSGGLSITPNFTVDNAPKPDLIVVPHFDHPRPSTHETSPIHQWIKQSHQQAALTMSVCTGAFQLAKTGLLDGLPVTTNQRAYDNFAKSFPNVQLHRGPRFVEAGRIATSGGLSAGIDLALRVVVRYFGEDVAGRTADTMEYVGSGWRT